MFTLNKWEKASYSFSVFPLENESIFILRIYFCFVLNTTRRPPMSKLNIEPCIMVMNMESFPFMLCQWSRQWRMAWCCRCLCKKFKFYLEIISSFRHVSTVDFYHRRFFKEKLMARKIKFGNTVTFIRTLQHIFSWKSFK